MTVDKQILKTQLRGNQFYYHGEIITISPGRNKKQQFNLSKNFYYVRKNG